MTDQRQSEDQQSEDQQRYYDTYWSAKVGWKPKGSLRPDLQRWIGSTVSVGNRVLDVGCGDGVRYAPMLLKAGIDLYGVEISPQAVAMATANGIKAQCVDLSQPLPFETASFDRVMCLEVLEHLIDPEYAVREIRRVLKPGGMFLVSVPNVGQWRRRVELLLLGRFDAGGTPMTGKAAPWRDPHIRFFSAWSLRQMLILSGFRLVRQGGVLTEFFQCAPILRNITRPKFMRPVSLGIEWIGSKFPSLLSEQLIALAQNPEH